MRQLITFIFLIISQVNSFSQSYSLPDYTDAIRKQGQEPIAFINAVLGTHDLVVFDDALHFAVEPFEFYMQLVNDKTFRSKAKYVFVEVFSVASQPHIDKYLQSPTGDSSLLFPVFQDDFSGFGWQYKTYFDFMSAVWKVNGSLPDSEKIRVIGVDQPVYWCGLNNNTDYLFSESLEGRDYFMYQTIINKMGGFKEGRKGIFLTNTRHAYKGIQKKDGGLFLNCNTFFNLFNPGKTYSVRFHNVALMITGKKQEGAKTIEGTDAAVLKWVRMEKGLWDEAFKENGNKPVAIPLTNNAFGKAAYIGNHMMEAKEGQMMYDAYDAVIFLVPLEKLRFSARVDWIYTPAFRKELERRIVVTQPDLDAFLKENDVKSIAEFVAEFAVMKPERSNPLVPLAGPIDEWKKK